MPYTSDWKHLDWDDWVAIEQQRNQKPYTKTILSNIQSSVSWIGFSNELETKKRLDPDSRHAMEL